MELHNVIPGSPEWLALRAQPNTYTASEAPAMMGFGLTKKRNELLAEKHNGLAKEVSSFVEDRVFAPGHEAEAAFRPVAEEIIGDELYPCTGSVMVDGMRLLASFDGLTMDRKFGFEHKLANANIAVEMALEGEPGPAYHWQLEQQLLVSGAEKILFACSNGTKETGVTCWYESKPERRAALVAGWKQFAEDLKTYTPPAAATVVVAEAVQALPAVLVQVTGEIAIKDNFKTFETALRDFLDHRLIREPKTDQNFADLELQIKAMKAAEDALAAAESQMLAQVQSIDQAKKTKDMLAKLVRDNRLMAEKLLASEKERRRGEIVADSSKKFQEHINGLNARLARTSNRNYMPIVPADFAGVIKGMKSMTSMENAVATELARAKIAANEIADRLQRNLDYLREHAKDYAFLFSDTAQIIQKAPDDLQALVQNRITEHKAAEARKEEETRERIRAEEERKAQAAAQAEQDRIREEAAAKARQDLIDEQAAIEAANKPATAPAPTAVQPLEPVPASRQRTSEIARKFVQDVQNEKPTLKLGTINERLGFTVTADFLAELGFAATTERAAKLYRESQWPAICEALVQHITQVADLQPA